jgi:hypothetical protein
MQEVKESTPSPALQKWEIELEKNDEFQTLAQRNEIPCVGNAKNFDIAEHLPIHNMKKLYTLLPALALLISAQAQPVTHTIMDVQGMEFSSPIVDQPVTVEGIVTANNMTGTAGVLGYFLQDLGGGPWSGVFVYDNTQAPEIGDIVILSGTVAEYFDCTEILDITEFTTVSSGNTVPDPIVLATGTAANAEPYEGVFVRVENAECTVPDADFGQAYFDDGSGECMVDDFAYLAEWSEGVLYNIQGPLHYSYEEYKIEVRNAEDAAMVGLTEMDRIQPLTAWPNPTAGELRLEFPAEGELVVLGLDGKLAKSQRVQAGQGVIAMDGLTVGLYIVELRSQAGVYRTRVSKH